MTRIGGVSAFMARIWTGEVWVRRIVPSSAGRGGWLPGSATYRVSHRSRDGWSGGMLSASKFHHSVSISGPSNTSKPKAWKISRKSRSAVRVGCRWPMRSGMPGAVMSSRSASSRASSCPGASPRPGELAIAASISALTSFASLPSVGPLRGRNACPARATARSARPSAPAGRGGWPRPPRRRPLAARRSAVWRRTRRKAFAEISHGPPRASSLTRAARAARTHLDIATA